jgi:hypothetical protein
VAFSWLRPSHGLYAQDGAGLSPGFFSVRFVRLLVPFSRVPKLDLPRRQSP